MGKTVKGKEKVKAKIAKAKKKIARKCKGCYKLIPFAAALAAFCGCSMATPASRATSANYGDFGGDVKVVVENSTGTTVNVSLPIKVGDGALASADSSGSTETQTATPTLDIKPDIDVHYNDAIKNATDASKGVLETLAKGSADAVVRMMASGDSGTVKVQKSDGSAAVVKCENGQCSLCTDCKCTDCKCDNCPTK